MMLLGGWLGFVSTVLTMAAAAPGRLAPEAHAPATVTFDFANERYLVPRQRAGGMAYVTSGVPTGSAAPLIVFLHGLNPTRALHTWFNGEPGDLRPLLEGLVRRGAAAPFVFAGPTQSKDALVPQILWPD